MARLVAGFARAGKVWGGAAAWCPLPLSAPREPHALARCHCRCRCRSFFSLPASLPPCLCAAQITAEEYAAAAPDPIHQFSGPVAGHMNEDHADATAAMIKHYVGITGGWGSRRVGVVSWGWQWQGAEQGGHPCPRYHPHPCPPNALPRLPPQPSITCPAPPRRSHQGNHPQHRPAGNGGGVRPHQRCRGAGRVQGAAALPAPRHRPQVHQGAHCGDDKGLRGRKGRGQGVSGAKRRVSRGRQRVTALAPHPWAVCTISSRQINICPLQLAISITAPLL